MIYIVGGKFKKRALVAPKTDRVRPTTSQLRETLFNICQQMIEGAEFLDIFAGSGAMGLEALSRGASHVTFVEKNAAALSAIKKNIQTLQVHKETTLYSCDVFKALQQLHERQKKFDLIYADPPYGEGFTAPLLEFLDRHSLLREEGALFIEDALVEVPPLKNLVLYNQRKAGRAQLYAFHRSNPSSFNT